jgi:hypothetical protein
LFSGLDFGHVQLVTSPVKGEGVKFDRPRSYDLFTQFGEFLDDAQRLSEGDLCFSVAAYGQEYRRKNDPEAKTRVVYADVDGFDPADFRVAPTYLVSSSPGHWHAYWLLDDFYLNDDAAEVSTAIAKTHGLDASSGIATKLLRVPGSVNTKYDAPHQVQAYANVDSIYTLEHLREVYQIVESESYDSVDLAVPSQWPEYFDALDGIPADSRIQWLMEWDKRTADDPDKRSEHRFELIRLLMEKTHLTPEQIAVVVWQCPVSDHFREQNRPIDHLYKFDIAKALGKQVDVAELEQYEPDTTADAVQFLSADELFTIYEQPGFLDKWREINYAGLHPKTPDQYIRINGYALLSAVFGNKVTVMPPGTSRAVFCNLYVLNVGETTSGKSEALFVLKRYIKAFTQKVGYEIFVGSSATAEGLIKALKGYDKRTAMMITEEVSGKFRSWQNSSSMAHAREAELEIYDNYLPKNLRAGDGAGSVENVHLSFGQYMMGVDSEVEALLDRGFLRSGYLPRLLIVKGQRSIFEVQEQLSIPQGDPNKTQDADPIPGQWADAFAESIRKNSRLERAKTGYMVMQFEDDAWARFLQFRASLLKFAESHTDPDVVRPMAIRFAISAQKMMALLAYERVAGKVQMVDVLRVLADCEDFWGWSMDVVRGVSDSAFARMQDEVLTWLIGRNRKARLVDFHTKYASWSLKERSDVLESLSARGIVRVVKGDKTTHLEMAE